MAKLPRSRMSRAWTDGPSVLWRPRRCRRTPLFQSKVALSGTAFSQHRRTGRVTVVLTNTGGAIGQGLPVAFGASLAASRRRVVAIQSDGSAQYTVQTLWSMAREGTDITVVLVSNRKYGILNTELQRLGHTSGDLANSLTSLTNPSLDWCATARGYGVPSSQVHSVGELRAALRRAHAVPGPTLVEAVVG
ncbi:MAG: hypothetical protein EOP31_16995 [Rhodococcus sp. (in: high G+C Gram-positive bacteria)]|nr:MAG: hypothetical protein EOP31_16995 [Rhodococcus sp. (in: high G+C Gram-positive bacteria)]